MGQNENSKNESKEHMSLPGGRQHSGNKLHLLPIFCVGLNSSLNGLGCFCSSVFCRFRSHSWERWPVVGADVAFHHGRQEADCWADRQGTLGQVWTSLLLQVRRLHNLCKLVMFSTVYHFDALISLSHSRLHLNHCIFDICKSVTPGFRVLTPFGQMPQPILSTPTTRYVSQAFTSIRSYSCPPHCLTVPILTSPQWEAQITAGSIPTDTFWSFPFSHREACWFPTVSM